MKKILILSLLISSISCGALNTEKDKNKSKTNISETLNNNDLKLAVIEGQRILKDSKEGQLIEELITKKRDDFAKEIQAIDQKIEKEIADIRAKQRTASQEVLEAKQEMLVKLQRSRDNRVQEAEAEFKNFANKKLAGFDKKLRKELVRWAEKNQFDCVSLKETGEVIYVSDKINYTPQLIDILDTAFETETKIQAAKEATKKI